MERRSRICIQQSLGKEENPLHYVSRLCIGIQLKRQTRLGFRCLIDIFAQGKRVYGDEVEGITTCTPHLNLNFWWVLWICIVPRHSGPHQFISIPSERSKNSRFLVDQKEWVSLLFFSFRSFHPKGSYSEIVKLVS